MKIFGIISRAFLSSLLGLLYSSTLCFCEGEPPRPSSLLNQVSKVKSSLNQDLVLYGEPRTSPASAVTRVGPFSFVFHEGMLKHLRVGRVEIARRVYFAVRDKDWDTVKPVISEVTVERTPLSFVATWVGRGQNGGEVDYLWKGRLEVFAEGTIKFTGKGTALTEFSTPRIGICLLLSSESTEEKAYEVTHVNGEKKNRIFQTIFPRTQPASHWKSLRFSPSKEIQAEYSIEGSHFDLEDQRNFGDVSYKAMAGMPYTNETARVGQELGQTLTIRVSSTTSLTGLGEDQGSRPVTLQMGSELKDARVPLLGVNCGTDFGEFSRDELYLLNELQGFLYFTLSAQHDDFAPQTKRFSKLINEMGKPVYLVVHGLAAGNQHRVTSFLKQMTSARSKVVQIAYTGNVNPELSLLRVCALEAGLTAPIGKMAIGTFQDRAPLIEAYEAKAAFLAWHSTPISHQDDDETIIENASVYPYQNKTARSFAPGLPISVGPIQFSRHGFAARPDPRYAGLVGAAFVASSIKCLAEGGTSLAVFFDAVGPEGHIYRKSKYPLPLFDRSNATQVFPSYHILKILGRWSGRSLVEVRSSDSMRVESFATRHEGGLEIVIINRTPQQQQIRLDALIPSDGNTSVVSLDEGTFPQCQVFSDGRLHHPPSTNRKAANGRLLLELRPYAVTIIRTTI